MAKKEQNAPETTGLDTVNDSLTAVTRKVQDNRKTIVIVSCIVVAIAVIILAYV